MLKSSLDHIMEITVIPSFSSIGSFTRSRLFNWTSLSTYQLTDKVVVLTGGTSGIGRAAASLYARLGATLVLVARSQEKTEVTISEVTKESGNHHIHGVIGDLGSADDVQRVAEELASRFPRIHMLVHNAGALYNLRRRAANGTDLSVELMVATPFLLTGLLLPQLIPDSKKTSDTPGRVITMSSGGMYTQALSVTDLEMPDELYHGARQYARAKRAQVVLNELWAKRVDAEDIVFHALHPGWVDTPGINEALPGFSRILGPLRLLRSAEVGADTMVWLSTEPAVADHSGLFWHDRAVRSIDLGKRTKEADTPEKRQALWDWCEDHTGWRGNSIPT